MNDDVSLFRWASLVHFVSSLAVFVLAGWIAWYTNANEIKMAKNNDAILMELRETKELLQRCVGGGG